MPATFDLRSVYPGLNTGGVFDIVYTLYNQCGIGGTTKIGKINIQTPTALSSLQTNAVTAGYEDVSYPSATSPSSPNDVGPVETTFLINGSYNTVPSTAPVCAYKYHVERWDGGTTWTTVGETTSRTAVCSLALVKTIGINIAAGGAGTPYKDFFEDNVNAPDLSVWRLVVELTNDCGTYTQYAVFRINRGGFRKDGPSTGQTSDNLSVKGENSKFGSEELVNKVSFAPVPFTNNVTARFSLSEAAQISMQVYAIDGRLVAGVKEHSMNAGNQKLEIATADWASGIYYYTCTIGKQVFNGKIIRK
ncbi:T9SS type A sorting domain-containing protein [Taibaiella koreensis]|uniref:T9SS type A sorting domain-containing protein n=1 Tax=Taibaiella koreensis TaxID=1268548 RepID=UPI0013C2ABE2|nr:T9SS type A sorting domain-containing protein [Taibaiella koreensis]